MAKRGPKPHRPTPGARRRVRLWSGSGISKETICRLLKVNYRTLEKHYTEELTSGAELAFARNLDRLEKAAIGGSVSAMRFLHDKLAVANGLEQIIKDEPKPSTLGKKEQALVDAKNAATEKDSDWGDDLETPPINLNSLKDVKGHA